MIKGIKMKRVLTIVTVFSLIVSSPIYAVERENADGRDDYTFENIENELISQSNQSDSMIQSDNIYTESENELENTISQNYLDEDFNIETAIINKSYDVLKSSGDTLGDSNSGAVVVPIDEDPKNFNYIDDTWGFENLTNYISIDKYEFYFDPATALFCQQIIDNGERGHCYGMSLSSAATWNLYPRINSYGDYDNLNEIDEKSISNELNCSANDYIDKAHIYQYTDNVQNSIHNNTDNYVGLYDAICEFEKTASPQKVPVSVVGGTNTPVIIGIYDGKGQGHAILGLSIAEESTSYTKIRVYDSNHPNERCYLTLFRTGNKSFSGWYYDDLKWGSNDGGYISYSQPSTDFIRNNDYTYSVLLMDRDRYNNNLNTAINYGGTTVNKNSYGRYSANNIIPINPTNGESETKYQTYWLTENKKIQFNDVNSGKNIGLAKGNVAMFADTEGSGDISFDINTNSVEVAVDSPCNVAITYDICNGYNSSKEISIDGTPSNKVSTNCNDNTIMFNGLDSCYLTFNERNIDSKGYTQKTEINQLSISGLNKDGKYCIKVIDSEKKYLQLMQDTDNDGLYETEIANSEANGTLSYNSFEINDNIILENNIVVYGDLIVNQGKTLDLNGHSFTVYGNATIKGDCNLNNGKLDVKGDVEHKNGTITFNKGLLEVGGDYSQTDGTENFISLSGIIKMENDDDSLIVHGNISFDKINTNDVFDKGTITLYGDLLCKNGTLNIAELFNVVINGKNNKVSGNIKFGSLYINSKSAIFKGSIGIKKLLTNSHIVSDDINITIENQNEKSLEIDGNLNNIQAGNKNGGNLCINGNIKNGYIYTNHGTVKIKGNCTATVVMSYEDDYFSVDGKAEILSNSKFNKGKAVFYGDVSITNSNISFSEEHQTVIAGDDTQIIQLSYKSGGMNYDNSFGSISIYNNKAVFYELLFKKLLNDAECLVKDAYLKVNLDQGKRLKIDGNITHSKGNNNIRNSNINIDDGDIVINGDTHDLVCDIKKGCVTINGEAEIYHSNINQGSLIINGNCTFNTINMNCEESLLSIQGDTHYYSGGYWKNGTTIFDGDLIEDRIINDEYDYKGLLCALEEHVSIFSGNRKQLIQMYKEQNGSWGESADRHCSFLGSIKFENTDIDFSGIGFRKLLNNGRLKSLNGVIWSPEQRDHRGIDRNPFTFNDPLDFAGNTLTINGDTIIDGKCILNAGSLIINGNLDINSDLKLDKGEITISNDITQHKGRVWFNNARFIVNGSYNKEKYFFQMHDNGDYFYVGGDINMPIDITDFVAGTIELKGNMFLDYQNNIYNPETYFKNRNNPDINLSSWPEIRNRLILSGDNKQKIEINSKKYPFLFNEIELKNRMDNYSFSPSPCWWTLITADDSENNSKENDNQQENKPGNNNNPSSDENEHTEEVPITPSNPEGGDTPSAVATEELKSAETHYKGAVNIKDTLLSYFIKTHPEAVIKKTKFKSSNKKVAKVNKKGIVKGGKKSGSATITMYVKTQETITKPNGKQKKKTSKWTEAGNLTVNNTGK